MYATVKIDMMITIVLHQCVMVNFGTTSCDTHNLTATLSYGLISHHWTILSVGVPSYHSVSAESCIPALVSGKFRGTQHWFQYCTVQVTEFLSSWGSRCATGELAGRRPKNSASVLLHSTVVFFFLHWEPCNVESSAKRRFTVRGFSDLRCCCTMLHYLQFLKPVMIFMVALLVRVSREGRFRRVSKLLTDSNFDLLAWGCSWGCSWGQFYKNGNGPYKF